MILSINVISERNLPKPIYGDSYTIGDMISIRGGIYWNISNDIIEDDDTTIIIDLIGIYNAIASCLKSQSESENFIIAVNSFSEMHLRRAPLDGAVGVGFFDRVTDRMIKTYSFDEISSLSKQLKRIILDIVSKGAPYLKDVVTASIDERRDDNERL